MQSNSQNESQLLQQAKRFVSAGFLDKAIELCHAECKKQPALISLGILLSQLYQQTYQFDKMLNQIDLMSEHHAGKNILIEIRKSECLIYTSQIKQAIELLDELYQQALNQEKVLIKLAELYIHCAQHEKVALCHQRALELSPNSPQNIYNLSFSKLTLGKIKEAELLIDQVLQKTNNDFDAYYSRSTLTKKTADNNNVTSLIEAFNHNKNNPNAVIALGYSLGKELEDLGDYQQAFKYIEQAAKARRQGLSYQVSNDVKAIDQIIQSFSQQQIDKAVPCCSTDQPIFIMGLPRSGTTLIEQVLTTHTKVASLGEVNSFAFAMMHTVGQNQGKLDLIKKSASTNFELLASRYTEATRGYGIKGDYLIDKTPLNFLYIGLIKMAFPKARIIHLKRHPLDSCFAMYKTLFRMGYPFSYDLNDLAEYYAAYHRLMEHWQDLYGEQIYHLDYQQFVNDPEQQSKKLINYCQLDWQQDILNFHQNESASATASAAQVRQPIYKSSVDRWKCYEKELQPLKKRLIEKGIQCD